MSVSSLYPPAQVTSPPKSHTAPRLWSGGYIALFVLTGILGGLFCLGALLGGPTGTLCLLATAASLALVVASLHYLDRFEPEPWSNRAWALTWGMTVCISGALVLEVLLAAAFTADGELALGGTDATATLIAPLVEEALKGLGVLLLVRMLHITRPLNALIYGGLIAAGFAAIEDLAYYLSAASEDRAGLLTVLIARGLFSPFSHPLFTAFTAIGLAMALRHRTNGPAFLGFGAAVVSHATWNLLASRAETLAGALASYAMVMVPLFVGVCTWAFRQHRAECEELKHAAVHVAYELSQANPAILWDLSQRSRHRVAVTRSRTGRRSYDRWVSSMSRLALHRLRDGTNQEHGSVLANAVSHNKAELDRLMSRGL